MTLRPACLSDIPALNALIAQSGIALSRGFYSDAQARAMTRQVYGVDTQLIVDGTYYAIETGAMDDDAMADDAMADDAMADAAMADAAIVACGGWSKRGTLFGSDHAKAHGHGHGHPHDPNRADPPLDCATDAARIRAFFVAPPYARRGLGSQLMRHCAAEAWAAGFRRLTLVSTLPGEPLYAAFGFTVDDRFELTLDDGLCVPLSNMSRELSRPNLD